MVKITIVLHDLRGGGAEKMMVRLANELANTGDDVELLLIGKGGVNAEYVNDDVLLTELDCSRTLQAFSPLRKHLKTRQPDAILSVLTHINVLTALACISLGLCKRLSMSERNTFSLDSKLNTSLVMRATYTIAPFLYRYLPNPVISVSKGVSEDLVNSTIVRNKDVVSAPNPVITDETIEAAKQSAQHPWLVNKTSSVIVSVGRLAHQKGYDLLLEAFAQAVEKKPDCKLIIFGEGELKEQLERQAEHLAIAEQVSLAGYTNNPIAEIKHADIFVLSSRFEGSPNGLVEAMSVATPVIAFNCPHGPYEILQAGTVAPLIPAESVADLSSAIVEQLNQRHIDVGKVQKAAEPFSAEYSAKSYKQLLFAGS